MATRPSTTLLLLTRHVIVRADFSAANAMTGVWQRQRPDVSETAFLVNAALNLGPKPGAKVYVLSTDLWTQSIALGKETTAGMSALELAAALNFEAESLSGQSTLESVVSFQALPPGEGFWIVQARISDIADVDEVIRKAGSRFGGLLHPAGVPASLDKREARWARLEFWPDAVVLLRGDWQGPASVQVLNADPQLGRWKPEWDRWRHGMGESEVQQVLVGPGMNPPVTATETNTLDDASRLSTWLTSWAAHLAGSKPEVPLLRPMKKPLSTGQRAGIALVLAIAAILLSLAPYWSFATSLKSVRAEQSHLDTHRQEAVDREKRIAEAQKKELKAKETQLALTEKRIKDLLTKQKDAQAREKERRAQLKRLEHAVNVVQKQRKRVAALLTKLGDHGIEDLAVKSIDGENGEPCVRGICLHGEAADDFAALLAKELAVSGWAVQAPKKQLADDGMHWNFEVVIRSADMRVELEKSTDKGKR